MTSVFYKEKCGRFLTEWTGNLRLYLFTEIEIYFLTTVIDHQLSIYE